VNVVARFWQAGIGVLRQPSLHREALFLAAATITSGLGSLIYWKLITLRFTPEMVGLISAAIASTVFISGLSNLGLTAGLARFLPQQEAGLKFGLIRITISISQAMGLVMGFVFLFGKNLWAPNIIPPQAGPVYVIIFMVLLLATIQMNTNTAVIQSQRRTPYLLLQSVIINIVQITGGALVGVSLGVSGILLTYTLPILVVAVGFYFALPWLAHFAGATPVIIASQFKDLLRYSFNTQIFGTFWQLPAFIFPLMTLAKLGAEASARLALTWYAYNFLTIIPNAIVVALLVDGAHEPDRLPHRLWEALCTNLVILTPMVILIACFSPWLLGFFGVSYVPAAPLLQLMAISVLPISVNGLFITRWRIRKQMLTLNIFTAFLIFVSILLPYLLIPQFGLNGIGWGWLTGQTVFALAVIPKIIRERWPAAKGIVA